MMKSHLYSLVYHSKLVVFASQVISVPLAWFCNKVVIMWFSKLSRDDCISLGKLKNYKYIAYSSWHYFYFFKIFFESGDSTIYQGPSELKRRCNEPSHRRRFLGILIDIFKKTLPKSNNFYSLRVTLSALVPYCTGSLASIVEPALLLIITRKW